MIDLAFYRGEYGGTVATDEEFAANAPRGWDLASAMTRACVDALPDGQLTLFKKAACAMVDWLCLTGGDGLFGLSGDWTVGRVAVSGGGEKAAPPPLAVMYMDMAGLLNGSLAAVG